MSEHALPLPTSAVRWRRPLPGFGLGLGLGLTWLGLVVLLPLAALILRSGGLGLAGWLRAISDPRVIASLKVSFATAFVAAVCSLLGGALIAWSGRGRHGQFGLDVSGDGNDQCQSRDGQPQDCHSFRAPEIHPQEFAVERNEI